MRASSLLIASLLAAPAPLLADGTYTGCGASFGTCAAVTISSSQLASGQWQVTVTMSNTSWGQAPGDNQNARLTDVYLDVPGGVPSGTQLSGITDGNGRDVSHSFGLDASGGNIDLNGDKAGGGTNGARKWAANSGTVSPECMADPACGALRQRDHYDTNGVWREYGYFAQPITFTFTTDSWSDQVAVSVTQRGIGGVEGNEETYSLSQGGTTVTPEPTTMTLLASGLAGMALRRKRRAATTA